MRQDWVLETVNGLPPEFEVEKLIEKLIFIEKVEKGETQTHEAVKQIVKTWRKQSDQGA